MAMEFSPHAGWMEWHSMALEDKWERCWVVVSRDNITCYVGEDCTEFFEEYDVTATTCVFKRGSEDLPEQAAQYLEGRQYAFVVRMSDEEDSTLVCFDANTKEQLGEWSAAVGAAAACPRTLEAYIDDFSDVEDDTHARKCSLFGVDDMDWSKLEVKSMKSERSMKSDRSMRSQKSRSSVRATRSSRTSTESAGMQSAGSAEGRSMVMKASLGDEEDTTENDAARRSSLEMGFNIDWNKMATERPPDVGLVKPIEEGPEDEEADGKGTNTGGSGHSEAAEAKTTEENPAAEGAFAVAFGECW